MRELPGWIFLDFILLAFSLAAAEPGLESTYRLQYHRCEGGAEITGHGTAVANGLHTLLTAWHNTECGGVQVEIGGQWIDASVKFSDKSNDLALLKVDADLPAYVLLAPTDAVPGDKVVLCASLLTKDDSGFHPGPIEAIHGRLEIRWHDGEARFLADMDKFNHGASGGGIFSGACLVGIAVAGILKDGDVDKTKALYVPLVVIRNFLEGAR